MKSQTISLYHKWVAKATDDNVAFVDEVYAMCEKNYERGGDMVVECLCPDEIVDLFTTLAQVKEYCGLHVEAALNARWGEGSDLELKTSEAFKEWE